MGAAENALSASRIQKHFLPYRREHWLKKATLKPSSAEMKCAGSSARTLVRSDFSAFSEVLERCEVGLAADSATAMNGQRQETLYCVRSWPSMRELRAQLDDFRLFNKFG
jgi:hypothetical protein